MTDDDVWTQIELGAGRALPYRVLQFGDTRCNRTSWGIFVNGRYVPVLEEDDPAEPCRTRLCAALAARPWRESAAGPTAPATDPTGLTNKIFTLGH